LRVVLFAELGVRRVSVMRLVHARSGGCGIEFLGSIRCLRTGWPALLLWSAALIVSPLAAQAQNLIVNGDFATNGGNLTSDSAPPWTPVPGDAGYVVLTGPSAQNGIAFLDLYHFGSGSAMQSVTVSRAGTYTFSFWYKDIFIPISFSAIIDGKVVFNTSNYSSTSWALFSTTVTLAAGTTTVEFLNNNTLAIGLDTVSLIFAAPTALTLPTGTPTNQTNTANTLNSFLNGGGTLPANFQNLFNLSGTQLQTALTQLDGEAATDAEKGAFELMNEFMGLMLDPFVAGRTGSVNGIGFAPEQQASFPPDIAQAYASVFKAPPMTAPPTQQWTAWGSGFGASSTTNGNASVGSNNVTAADYGFAGGMDYHYTRDSLVGFALAGAGTNWNLAQGLGGGRSDAFQAGVYTKTYYGPAYVAGALAFANNWFTTDRSALGDQLQASFNGQSYGGRFESGYRYGLPVTGSAIGATPYAAIQTQWFHTPTYSETDLSSGGLGLTYNAMTANDTRSELGARFDDLTALNGMPLILRTRLAWAHDWVSNPALDAVFQSLPGASFIVDGAKPPSDSALVSAGAELHVTANWSIAAKFDGEFADGSQTYGGSGTLRYTW
jgi:Autotransporter beta-domain